LNVVRYCQQRITFIPHSRETSLAKIKGRKIDGRLKAIEPSNRGRLEYASDASLVASSYDGQWRREEFPEGS